MSNQPDGSFNRRIFERCRSSKVKFVIFDFITQPDRMFSGQLFNKYEKAAIKIYNGQRMINK